MNREKIGDEPNDVRDRRRIRSVTAIEQLAEFASNVSYGDLPAAVAEYTKLLICDSLTCARGARALRRGRMATKTWSTAGGPEEARIVGEARPVSARNAAAANADLANVLDADDTFLNSAHFAVTNVAPALAESERCHSPGKSFVVAVAVGFEVNARVHLAMLPDTSRPADSNTTFPTLGAAVSAAVGAGLDARRIAEALAIACWLTPTTGTAHLRQRHRFTSFKYAPYAAMAAAGVDAARFAVDGYHGDLDALDTDFFACGQGAAGFDPHLLLDGLGDRWWIADTSVKPYPSFRIGHGHLDALRRAMHDEGIGADDVKQIELFLDPRMMSAPLIRHPRPLPADETVPFAGAMNLPHSLACLLAGIAPGPDWYSAETVADPGVAALAARVKIAERPAVPIEEFLARRDPLTGRLGICLGETRISAGGRELVYRVEDCLGDPWNGTTKWTWDAARTKLQDFVGEELDAERVAAHIRQVRTLDRLSDTAELSLLA